MTDVSAQREAAILPDGLAENEGHFVPAVVQRHPLSDDSFNARSVDAALQGIYDVLGKPTSPNLLTLAKLLGAAYFVGTVQAASDTAFPHALGRVPVLIVHTVDVNGGSGSVVGRPEAGGPNTTRWSSSAIYVRATATGRYAFFVI